jgi:hypothetical protein
MLRVLGGAACAYWVMLRVLGGAAVLLLLV